jgi:uncharacterized protein (TIGR02246 family)
MSRRRLLVVGALVAALGPSFAVAQSAANLDEQKLRETLRNYQAAWNKHDVNAWSAFLTDDIWYTEAWDFYGRQKGRENAVNLFKSNFKESDLTLQVTKIRMMPDGTATVAMKETISHLPKADGKYKAVFESEPVMGRWRKEGGAWKMFFYTSHKGWALDQLKKDGLD